jgi:hypothetical protein
MFLRMSKRIILPIVLLVSVFVVIKLYHRTQGIPVVNVVDKERVSNSKKNCPSGFVFVNGDETYKTDDFCVMKYDAKCTNTDPKCITKEGVYRNNASGCSCQGSYQVVSMASGAPITYIPEDDGTPQSAKAYCRNAGWHLVTNSEWMTIARDVEKVPGNWCNKDGTSCGNTPGTYGNILANGHNDTFPNKALPAGRDDQPCFGTTADGSDKCGGISSQKRTLTLQNGEVIWDFAGNVWQWVDELILRRSEPHTEVPALGLGGSHWVWSEFSKVPFSESYSPSNPNWISKNGVGRIFHYNLSGDTDTTEYTFIRGGNWRHGYDSGAFTIHMQPVPGKTNIDDIGFRCAVNPN